MTYTGIIRNGKVEVDQPVDLPDGTPVRVEPVGGEPDPFDGLLEDSVDVDIPDAASQHDHYIYGTQRRG